MERPLDIRELFEEFKTEHGIVYASAAEEARRFETFEANVGTFVEFNQAMASTGHSARLGTTRFADWSQAEFSSRLLLPRTSWDALPCLPSMPAPSLAAMPLPTSFDFPAAVSGRVLNQGTVGTCWAFSTVQSVQSLAAVRAKAAVVELSVEQLSDCDGGDCGVFGGWPCRAMGYVRAVGGLVTAEEYPYCEGTGACYPCMAPGYNKTFCGPGPSYCNGTQYPCRYPVSRAPYPSGTFAASIEGYFHVGHNETEMQLRMLQREGSPISVLIDAQMLQWYEGGVWEGPIGGCDPTGLDHAVLLTGFGVHDDVLGKFPFWRVKNSWGESWGDGGYFMLGRSKNVCGVAEGPILPKM